MLITLRHLKLLCTTLSFIWASFSWAELTSLNEEDLSDITGQAFINLETDQNGSTDYTRINFGTSGKIQVNADELVLGRYDRAGEAAGTADIDIDNFALGHIDDNGNIIPFEFEDPYLEVAYENGSPSGVRIGFKEAKGSFTGDFNALTGYIPIKIEGRAEPIIDQATFGQWLLLGIAGVGNNTILSADAELVTAGGDLDPVRAQWIGVKNGDTLDAPNSGWSDGLLSLFASNNCAVLGIATCFPLSQYKSLPIGNYHRDQNAGESDADYLAQADTTKGFFISVSKREGLRWRDLDNTANTVPVQQGAFMYLPKSGGQPAITVDFEQALGGIPRKNTCFGGAVGC